MNAPIIAFFSVKRGVGTTSLVYHLAWMYSDLGVKVLAVDLDPQASLTTAFVGTDDQAWFRDDVPLTETIGDGLILSPADLRLASWEDDLADQWRDALTGSESAFETLLRPWRRMNEAASRHDVQLVLLDLGPNLSAINRSGLLAADHVVLSVPPGLPSIRAIEVAGSALRQWRSDWRERSLRRPPGSELPEGNMRPLGYVLSDRAGTSARSGWAYRPIANAYRDRVCDDPVRDYSQELAVLRSYPSLFEMAKEARKPTFHLKPADGAMGAYLQAAEDVRKEFEALAKAIVTKANLPIAFR